MDIVNYIDELKTPIRLRRCADRSDPSMFSSGSRALSLRRILYTFFLSRGQYCSMENLFWPENDPYVRIQIYSKRNDPSLTKLKTTKVSSFAGPYQIRMVKRK